MKPSEETVEKYLEAWKKGDHEAMFDLCQKTWKQGKAPVNLKDILPNSKLKSYKKISSTTISSASRTFGYQLTFANDQVILVGVKAICEVEPYKPAPYGDWGVNPHSALNVVTEVKKADPKKVTQEEKNR